MVVAGGGGGGCGGCVFGWQQEPVQGQGSVWLTQCNWQCVEHHPTIFVWWPKYKLKSTHLKCWLCIGWICQCKYSPLVIYIIIMKEGVVLVNKGQHFRGGNVRSLLSPFPIWLTEKKEEDDRTCRFCQLSNICTRSWTMTLNGIEGVFLYRVLWKIAR